MMEKMPAGFMACGLLSFYMVSIRVGGRLFRSAGILAFQGCAIPGNKDAAYRMGKKKGRICTPCLVVIRCFCIR